MKIFLFFLIISLKGSVLKKDFNQDRNLIDTQPATTTSQPRTVQAPIAQPVFDDEDVDKNIATQCNQEMMTAYGLTGYNKPMTKIHKYCPNITHNCCTPDDEIMSMQLWTSQNRYLIEKYYETYLYSVKYILGYSVQGTILAQEFETSKEAKCKEASVDYLDMNMNPKVTEDIYFAFVQALEKMGVVRKGFYCILCDAQTQDRLTDYWSATNLFYNDRIYFSKGFCRELVEGTIRAAYYTVFYLKRYAENLATLINCRIKSDKPIIYDIPYWTKQQVKNCYFFKNNYFFFFCERYCEKFHLVKANSIFDGDLTELKKFVDLIMTNKNQVFNSPDSNILMTWVTYEEDILKYNYQDVFENNIFFKASTKRVQLDTFETDVLYVGGMNPWRSCDDNLYELVIASFEHLKIGFVLMLIGLLLME
jgi:hypothetical protein